MGSPTLMVRVYDVRSDKGVTTVITFSLCSLGKILQPRVFFLQRKHVRSFQPFSTQCLKHLNRISGIMTIPCKFCQVWKKYWRENLNIKILSISNEYYHQAAIIFFKFWEKIFGPYQFNCWTHLVQLRCAVPTSASMSSHLPALLPPASSFINREELTGGYSPQFIPLWRHFWSFLQLGCKNQHTVGTFYTHVGLPNMTEISLHLSEVQATISITFWVTQPVLAQTSLNKPMYLYVFFL